LIEKEELMDAIIISSDLQDYLKSLDHLEGKVHSVFDNTINIMTHDQRLISVFSSDDAISPMSLSIGPAFSQMIADKDSTVVFESDGIRWVDIKQKINVNYATKWEVMPVIEHSLRRSTYLGRLRKLEKVLFDRGNTQGILMWHIT